MSEPSGQCAEGYYCPEGQSSEGPQQHVCSVGHYCQKVKLPVFVFKLLSSIVCKSWFSLCHPDVLLHTITQRNDVSFLFFLRCLSPLPVLCLSHSRLLWFHYVFPNDTCSSPAIKSNKINLMLLQGSVRQTACLPGSYQLRKGQGACEMCPAGFYCQDQGKTDEMDVEAFSRGEWNGICVVSVFQEWLFHFRVREDFIVPLDQQIHIPVLQELMETCPGLLRNGSVRCVTLGCTVKEQVQWSFHSDPNGCLLCSSQRGK